jgi:hypothetical protein
VPASAASLSPPGLMTIAPLSGQRAVGINYWRRYLLFFFEDNGKLLDSVVPRCSVTGAVLRGLMRSRMNCAGLFRNGHGQALPLGTDGEFSATGGLQR